MNIDNVLWLLDSLSGECRTLRQQMQMMLKNHQDVRDNVVLEATKAGADQKVIDAIEALWSSK